MANTYDRPSVQLKIFCTAGGVSGFQQATSERFANALAQEVDGAVEGMAQLIEWSLLNGNTADSYQFNGLGLCFG